MMMKMLLVNVNWQLFDDFYLLSHLWTGIVNDGAKNSLCIGCDINVASSCRRQAQPRRPEHGGALRLHDQRVVTDSGTSQHFVFSRWMCTCQSRLRIRWLSWRRFHWWDARVWCRSWCMAAPCSNVSGLLQLRYTLILSSSSSVWFWTGLNIVNISRITVREIK